MNYAEEHKMIPYVYPKVCNFLSASNRMIYEKIYSENIKRVDKYIFEIKLITKVFQEQNISFQIVKGIPLSQIIYNSPYMRRAGDIDILVDTTDFIEAYTILKSIGYVQWINYDIEQDCFVTTQEMAIKYREDYYEYQCIKEDTTGRVFLEIKRATSAINSNLIDVFRKTKNSIMVNGVTIDTFDVIHTFIHLCMNIFANGESTQALKNSRKSYLRDYVDLYHFLKKYNFNNEYKALLEIIQKYELVKEIKRVLYNFRTLFGDRVNIGWISDFAKEDASFAIQINNGSLYAVQWNTPIDIRIFNQELHRKEYILLYKQSHYSNKNPYISQNNFYYINDKGKHELSNYVKVFTEIQSAQISICFRLECNKTKRYLTIAIKQEDIDYLDNIELAFSLFDNDIEKIDVFKILYISFVNRDKIYGKYNALESFYGMEKKSNNIVFYTIELEQDINYNLTSFLCYGIEFSKKYNDGFNQRFKYQYGVLHKSIE